MIRIKKNSNRNQYFKKEEESISSKFKSEKMDDLMVFQNVPPKWIESRKGYFLNFNDRVKISSVKNFQIISKVD